MLEPRLVNWGRVYRDRIKREPFSSAAPCKSIEHRYRIPPQPQLSKPMLDKLMVWGHINRYQYDQAILSLSRARQEGPDEADAALVEEAWSHIPVNDYQAILSLFYVKKRPPWYIERRLRLADGFDFGLMYAHIAIDRELGNLDSIPLSYVHSKTNGINHAIGL
jgi:hypothetical protein